jgi:hypothetical protein
MKQSGLHKKVSKFMKVYAINTWGLCYKTFYGRNLLIFVIRVFVSGNPFQPSLMFVGEAGSLP